MTKLKPGLRVGRVKKSKDVLNRFERVLQDSCKKTVPVSYGRMYASAAGLCARKTATVPLIGKGETATQDISSQFYFTLGSSFEEVFKKAFKDKDIYLADEIRVESIWPEIPLSGRVDFIIKDPVTGNPTLMELKSCGKLPEKPKPQHLGQLKTYMVLCGLEDAVIWYMSRNIAAFGGKLVQKCFEVHLTEADKLETAKSLAIAGVYFKNKIIPKIPEDMKKYKCGFCPLKKFCWEDAKMDIDAVHETYEIEIKLKPEVDRIVEMIMSDQDELRDSFLEASVSAKF